MIWSAAREKVFPASSRHSDLVFKIDVSYGYVPDCTDSSPWVVRSFRLAGPLVQQWRGRTAVIQLQSQPGKSRENGFMKSTDGKIADQRAVGEILSMLAAVNVLVEDFRRELRRGVVAERAGSASGSAE